MQVGDLVINNYEEIGVIMEEWESEGFYYAERQYYVLYTNGSVVVTSEYDLELVCK